MVAWIKEINVTAVLAHTLPWKDNPNGTFKVRSERANRANDLTFNIIPGVAGQPDLLYRGGNQL